ncbi:MAG: cytochrome P450 [Holophagales bacterium]|nr:cytochrome P450 [Holophagales bacterium]
MTKLAPRSPAPTVHPSESEASAISARDFSREELEAGAALCPHAARHLALLKQDDARPEEDLASLKAPPTPAASRFRQTLSFMRDPFGTIASARAECGDLFLLDLLVPGPIVFACSAELLHRLYQLPEDVILAGEIRGRLLGALIGEKVSIGLDGPEYRARRKVTAPFLSGRQVLRWVPFIRQATEEELAEWAPGDELVMQSAFDRISRKVICRVLFGDPAEGDTTRLAELSGQYLNAFEWPAVQAPFLRFDWGPWSPWTRFKKRYSALYDAIDAEVVERMAEPERVGTRDDMLDALLLADLANDPAEKRDIVVQELIGMLVGGAETTSKALGWTFHGLLTCPEAVDKLRAELGASLGERAIEADDLDSLPYLEAVVHEGLRHQSVAPFAGPRLAKRTFELGGFRIEPETVIAQPVHEVGRSPIFPNQETYDPDHFYGREIKQRDWVPFGGGMRKCTGMGLALTELATVVATLVRKVDFEVLPGPMEPMQSGIAYRPKNGLRVRVGAVA